MPKTSIAVVASVVLLFVAAPAGAFVTFSGVASDYYSCTPETYFSVGNGSGVASAWNWSPIPFSNPPPVVDNGPATAGIFEEAVEFTPYGSNDLFNWNLGSLNTVVEDGWMGYGMPNQGYDWASVYTTGKSRRHFQAENPYDFGYGGDGTGEITSVPEPGTFLLVGLILVGGGVLRKWR